MKYSISLLALTLATFTSALPHPESLSKRSAINGAAYAHTGSGSHGASWAGDKHQIGHSGWGPPHEKDKRGGTGSPGSSWGGHGGGNGEGHVGGGWGPPQQKQQQEGQQQQSQQPQQQQQQQQQQDSSNCETAQCLDDIQDNTFEGLPNRASPPPDGSLTATTKEKRGSPAPGDSWGEGSGGEHNGQGVGDDSDFWGP